MRPVKMSKHSSERGCPHLCTPGPMNFSVRDESCTQALVLYPLQTCDPDLRRAAPTGGLRCTVCFGTRIITDDTRVLCAECELGFNSNSGARNSIQCDKTQFSTRQGPIFVCVIMKYEFTYECKWGERIDTATTELPSQKPPPFLPQSATTSRHSSPGVVLACRSGTVRRHNVKPVGVALERERAVSVLQDVLVLECCSRREFDSRGP